jgi:hypothetical protein
MFTLKLIYQKYSASGGSQSPVESTHDIRVDVEYARVSRLCSVYVLTVYFLLPSPSQSPGTPSASGNHPKSNQISTTTGEVTMSGFDKTSAESGTVSPREFCILYAL